MANNRCAFKMVQKIMFRHELSFLPNSYVINLDEPLLNAELRKDNLQILKKIKTGCRQEAIHPATNLSRMEFSCL